MSKIWDVLREAERFRNKDISKESLQNQYDFILDRRSTKRFLVNKPLLVYGHGAANDPFHERTEALSFNTEGGIISLSTAVNHGQTLLLINEVNSKEEKCTVVRRLSTDLNGTAIVVRFLQPLPHFGDKTHS